MTTACATWDFDVVIVGGGPAGSSTALHLARAEGILPSRLLLLDKATHPREKPCAGAVSGWGIAALAKIGLAVDVPHVTMRGLRILDGDVAGSSAWRASRTAEDLGVVVRRDAFDASLFRRAADDGVRACDGEGVVDLTRVPGGWSITTTKRTVRAPLLAACDGAGSTVRKRLEIAEPARKGHLYVLETTPEPGDTGPRGGLCDFDMTPSAWGLEGYYWDFPTIIAGAPHVSRGIYHANMTARPEGASWRGQQRSALGVKEALARSLTQRGIDIARVKLKPFSTRPFVAGSILEQDRLALVGEAAGIDRTTGEGIAQAILFGAIAAHHLAQALRLGTGRLEGYAADVRRAKVGRHLLQSAWLASAVYGPRGAGWRRFLAKSGSAREAGMRWYAGERLSVGMKARLAAGLAREIAVGRA